MNSSETITFFQDRQKEMLELLLKWVEIESPTTDKPSVDRFGEIVASALADLGMSIEINRQKDRGNHVVARWTGKGPKILMVGHMDTVWNLGTLEKMPAAVKGDVATGPGIFDMKAGIVIGLFALQSLRSHGLHDRNVTWVLNSDEEEGSETSRELIEHEASGCSAAFVLEPAGPNNGIKTKRRGVGHYEIKALGRAAHAGVDPEKGVNAIEELARQVLEIQGWNKLRGGISVNCGVLNGGTRSNVIPAEAHLVVDVRCDTRDDRDWIREKFGSLAAKHPEARLEVAGDINRPPMERTEASLALYRQAEIIGNAFDYKVNEYWTGGASDGNLTSALGVPTIDGLGAEGAGAHADNEHILVSSLPRRANLLYQLLRWRLEQ